MELRLSSLRELIRPLLICGINLQFLSLEYQITPACNHQAQIYENKIVTLVIVPEFCGSGVAQQEHRECWEKEQIPVMGEMRH